MVNVYLENTEIPVIQAEYSVETLREKFVNELKLQKNDYDELKKQKKELRDNLPEIIDAEDTDFVKEDLNSYYTGISEKQGEIVKTATKNSQEYDLLENYGEAFAQLYQIRENSRKFGDDAELTFKEVEQNSPVGVMTQEQYFEMAANPEKNAKQLALEVKLADGEQFDLLAVPYDKPGENNKNLKIQLAVGDDTINKLNGEKLAKITEFCETHGLSVFDMDLPYSFDGSLDIDAKFETMFRELQERERQKYTDNSLQEAHHQDMRREVLQHEAQGKEQQLTGDVSYDLPTDNEVLQTESNADYHAAVATPNAPAPAQNAPKNNSKKKKGIKDAEAKFEEFIEVGLGKEQGFSYFKEHTGWFGRGWTEYIIYDGMDPDNRKKDGVRDKAGVPKFTYSCKIFMKEEKDGSLRFAYRTPNHKKVDDSIVNGMAGQFKGLGITHVSFPNGLPDAEKKLWRIALAENGIVPKGMGLDRSKAEGMLEAAKKKLSAEDFSKFRYRLALQMEKDNIKKGKVVAPSEQAYIDSLKNAHFYEAFTEGYGNKLKSTLRDILDKADVNHEDGAVEKVAAYRALRRLFDAYKETVHANNILGSSALTDKEKQQIAAEGLTMPVHTMNEEQIGRLFEIMLPGSKAEAKKELDGALLDARDVNNKMSKGAKRADNVIIKEVFDGARSRFEKINEMLKSLGVEEIDFPKAFGRLHYDNFYVEHPEFQRKPAPTNTTPTNTTPTNTTPTNTTPTTGRTPAGHSQTVTGPVNIGRISARDL
jgi:hypothetical protein